jgi:hypothetical protein
MNVLVSARRDALDNPSSAHSLWCCKRLQGQ